VAALQAAALRHDVILTSGGVSVGEEDHIKPAVQQLGMLDLWSISMKPGKPFAYGRIGAAHFVGLPGNPVASWVTFLLLVKPMLAALQGQHFDIANLAIDLRADFAWPQADKRREFLRAKRNAQGGLEVYPNQSSGVLTSVVWADGLVDKPAGSTIAVGDTVRFIPFAHLLS
jgi:molybdopterin molybdotransferase